MKAGSLRTRPGYRWLICINSTLIMFCAVGLIISAFSIYLPYIRDLNGFTATQTNLLLTFRTLSQMVGILCISYYYKKLSYRVGAAIALTVLAIGFTLYGLANSYAMYCVAAIICGLAAGFSSSVGTMAINEWFTKDKALATSICAAGTGIASIVMPVIVTTVIENISLRAAFWMEGAFVLLIAIFTLFALRSSPNQPAAAEAPANQPAEAPRKKGNFNIPLTNALMLSAGVALFGLASYGIMGGLAQLLREAYSADVTSYLVTGFGITMFVGKLVYGRVTDRIGLLRANYIAFGALIVGSLGLFLFYRSLPLLILSLIIIGFGMPLSTVTSPLLATNFSAPGRYMNVLKSFSFIQTFGGFLVSYITGFFADLTGSNKLLFLILTVVGLASALLVQLSTRKALSK